MYIKSNCGKYLIPIVYLYQTYTIKIITLNKKIYIKSNYSK